MIPSCKRYLKKCDEFSLCVRCGDADFVEERSLLRSREKLLPADLSANDVGQVSS